jgi:hypothetical protein
MFNILYEDLLLLILFNLTNINDIVKLSTINNSMNQFINNDIYIEWCINIYSKEFWNRANKRTIAISKPYINMKMELLRLHNFTDLQNEYGHEKWTKDDYYKYWDTMEKIYTDKKITKEVIQTTLTQQYNETTNWTNY